MEEARLSLVLLELLRRGLRLPVGGCARIPICVVVADRQVALAGRVMGRVDLGVALDLLDPEAAGRSPEDLELDARVDLLPGVDDPVGFGLDVLEALVVGEGALHLTSWGCSRCKSCDMLGGRARLRQAAADHASDVAHQLALLTDFADRPACPVPRDRSSLKTTAVGKDLSHQDFLDRGAAPSPRLVLLVAEACRWCH